MIGVASLQIRQSMLPLGRVFTKEVGDALFFSELAGIGSGPSLDRTDPVEAM